MYIHKHTPIGLYYKKYNKPQALCLVSSQTQAEDRHITTNILHNDITRNIKKEFIRAVYKTLGKSFYFLKPGILLMHLIHTWMGRYIDRKLARSMDTHIYNRFIVRLNWYVLHEKMSDKL